MKGQGLGRPVEILLVEDNPRDVHMTQEAINDSKVRNNLHVTKDGSEGMAFLRREGKYADAPRPDLILLNLKLPRKDGYEVLGEIKADETLRRIPVVVLSTSDDEQDIIKAYNLYANGYIVKPIDLDQFFNIVNSTVKFWFTTVELPDE